MKKRLLSCLLTLALLSSMVPAALAADKEDVPLVLAALDIMTGDQDGNLNLGGTITRAEFTKMAVAASAFRDGVGDTVSVSPFPDVPRTLWSAPWIKAAVDANLVRGNVYGKYEPNRNITLAEGATIVLRLLGYADTDLTGAYPAGQMAMYHALKLDKGISIPSGDAMRRQDALNLFYNLLITKNKTGVYYLNTLEPTLNLVNASGEIDQVALINSAMEGPVVAETGWESRLPFSVSTAKVYRGGNSSHLSAIQGLDVVYYSASMRTLWAYDTRVTGTLESLSPSAAAPTAVTVAGKSYPIEHTAAAFALSDLGQFKVGASITLLLGRTGGVAAVRAPSQTSETTLYGVVTGVTTGTYTDDKGNSYNADTIQMKTTGNADYSYRTDTKNFATGDLVRVTTEQGNVQVKRLSSSSLEGRVSQDASKLGDYTISPDIEILDTFGKTGVLRIYPTRLAGMKLTSDVVRFYTLNTEGEIDHLILKDATGDLHQYGILTDVSEFSAGFTVASTYTYDVGGVSLSTPPLNVAYGLQKGPCMIKSDGGTIQRIFNLTAVKLDSAKGTTALSEDDRKYAVAEFVAVYELKNDTYYYTSLDRVNGSGYSLTGYYDKSENSDGRIRVILAKAN